MKGNRPLKLKSQKDCLIHCFYMGYWNDVDCQNKCVKLMSNQSLIIIGLRFIKLVGHHCK